MQCAGIEYENLTNAVGDWQLTYPISNTLGSADSNPFPLTFANRLVYGLILSWHMVSHLLSRQLDLPLITKYLSRICLYIYDMVIDL